MNALLHPEPCVYCVVPADRPPPDVPWVGCFREAEGLTLILEERAAAAHGLAPLFKAAWVTLAAPTALDSVGLTAAVSRALASAGIACNVVAAAHHDHLFVPWDRGPDVVRILAAMSGPVTRPGEA